MQNLFEDLKKILSQDTRFMVEGSLLKNKIIELALQIDAGLIKILLSNESMKKHFFQEIEGVFVFDKIKFQKFVSNKSFLPDSYTSFKNKIGLTVDDDFIFSNRDVVLSWPYKDCILEGGQTQDDARRNEVFWNETLAPDQVDRLLSPKTLTNFKGIDKNGEKAVTDFSFNSNLIIKGNNLLSLCSLQKVYQNRIKVIYIDPPYNTASAANTFAYNNTFNHSSWLTFMKNRLEIAKTLLTDDGVLAIAIDHYELFYLGALLDEIFKRENRMGLIAVVHNPGGRQDDAFFPTSNEYMIFYAKNVAFAKLKTLGVTEEKVAQYKLTDELGKYKLRGFRRSGNNSKRTERPGLFYSIFYDPKSNRISLEHKKGYIEILPIDEQGIERCWRWSSETLMKNLDNYIEVKETKNGYDVYLKERESDYEGEKAKTIWDKAKYTGQSGTNELKKLLGEKAFSYPKSPFLIMDVLKITTEPDDIVLDFFGGSGTTAHAVLDLNAEDGGNRKFILCEQMDYVENVTKERVSKVIKKNGEGEFVYCELAKANQNFVEQINSAKDKNALKSIWSTMQDKAFLSFKVNPKTINESAKEFEQLSFEDQQRFLIDLLDKNMLYIPYSEIADETYQIHKLEIELNNKFYNQK